MNTNLTRSRWAAIGAAVAVSLGAGGLGIARATSPSGAVTYVPITPCRLADTRPQADVHVGDRATPLPAGEEIEFTGRGATGVGDCDGLVPAEATALAVNVTALNLAGAPAGSFLTFYPTGEERPTTAALTVAPGQFTENSATVGLGTDGTFTVYNGFGAVDVIVDVTGYYVDHTHDDRYYTKDETDTAIAEATASASIPIDLRLSDTDPVVIELPQGAIQFRCTPAVQVRFDDSDDVANGLTTRLVLAQDGITSDAFLEGETTVLVSGTDSVSVKGVIELDPGDLRYEVDLTGGKLDADCAFFGHITPLPPIVVE